MLKKLMVTIAAAAIAVPALAQDYTLRANVPDNREDEDWDGMLVFKDYVEKASNGAIAVELLPGTTLCANGAECLQSVSDGTLDIYISTSGGAAGIFPYVQVFDLPYLMRDDRVAEDVLTGPFVGMLREKILEDSGGTIRLMTIGNTGGWRNFANTKKTVKTPTDLEGMKIRTVVADLPQELVKALGASPTPIPWPELFTSFQTGVVEGSKNGITDIMGMKFPDAGLTHITLDGHAYMAALWYINNEVFMSMPEDLRRVVADGFYQLQQATFASPKRKSISAYEEFREAGGEIYVPSPEEKEMFREVAAPVYDWFKENIDGGSEVYDALVAAAAEAEERIGSLNSMAME
ncbi:TRAP transporter substrate-binding protein DctP [Pseudoruegeria sp. HB172150]|uniref:TRAP transporter substrate-binding protein n=1 Tax=Pseudoruegeria sp. HB172150 TaxID=2721164 RepID=UPI001551A814|nr:TRAP transporter substrate-binding protein DctP [Pseudoruegeria sp. HB172150]